MKEALKLLRNWADADPSRSFSTGEESGIAYVQLDVEVGVGHHYRIPLEELTTQRLVQAEAWLGKVIS